MPEVRRLGVPQKVTTTSAFSAARNQSARAKCRITFTAIGLVSLIGGALLGSFSLRAESALIDPGLDEADRFFGPRGAESDRVPGAEAQTEKLPAPRPSDLPPDRPV